MPAPLPRLASIRTLERLALQGAEGRHWYRYATAEVAAAADRLGVTVERFSDVLAITSPRVSVRKNIGLAVRYLRTGDTTGMLLGVRSALQHYETTGEIRGPKTEAFARACRGDLSAVVLDVWMARAFGVDQAKLSDSPRVHREATRRIRAVARRLDWKPAEVQAAIWTATATLPEGEKRTDPADKRYRNAPQMMIVAYIEEGR